MGAVRVAASFVEILMVGSVVSDFGDVHSLIKAAKVKSKASVSQPQVKINL